MKSTEAAQRLREGTEKLARMLGDSTLEMAKGEFLTCEPNVCDGRVYPTFGARADLFPEAITVLEEEVVPAMEAEQGRLHRRSPGSHEARRHSNLRGRVGPLCRGRRHHGADPR